MGNIFTLIIMIFMILGAADLVILKGKLGIAQEFEHGFNSVGSLILAMAGIMCIAPVVGEVLAPIVAPLFERMGADPAMLAGILIGTDMGGYALTKVMTESRDIQILGGILLSSLLGGTIAFTIPVGLSICRPEDKEAITRGIVFGIISIPFGLLAGAWSAGISFSVFLVNSAPALVVSAVLAFCICVFTEQTLFFFQKFGAGLRILCMVSLVLASLEEVLGIQTIHGLAPLKAQMGTIGMIGVTLAGAYPLVYVLKRILAPAIKKISRVLRINEAAVTGLLAALANPFPFFDLIPDMDERGKVVAMAFSVSAMATFGDMLGYVSAERPDATAAMIVTKMTSGVVAFFIAEFAESGIFKRKSRVAEER